MKLPRVLPRLRGELRRMVHPAGIAASGAVALVAVYLQSGRAPYALAPSPGDALGALRIGFLQHGTLLGAALSAFLAGTSMGEDLRLGTVEAWRFSDPRWLRRWLRRVSVLVVLLIASAVLSAVVLRLLAAPHASGGPTSFRDLWVDALPSLAAIVLFASASLTASFFVRDPLLLVLLAVTLLTMPSRLGGALGHWALPAAWIGTGLHLTENGTSINYLAQQSGSLTRLPSQAIGLSFIGAATLAALCLGARLSEPRSRRR